MPLRTSAAYETWKSAPSVESPAVEPPGGPRSRRWHRPLWPEFRRWALVLTIWLPLVAVLLLGSLVGAIYWQARSDQTRPVEAIVVLGAAQYDGRPTPVLKARLDQALAAYRAGVAPLIVVTGGRQVGDRFTEAETSRDYLVDRGVPERIILLENEGHSSWESMQGAGRILSARGVKRILLVSDGYHLFRLKLMARHLGLTAFGAPATASPIHRGSRLEFDYVVREAGGVLDFLWHDPSG
ncbi:MAG TPA: YdcF family protein [Thermomicrobiales bacterium]|nr:YdcF family protein [Thermomicrobiales bacterium]